LRGYLAIFRGQYSQAIAFTNRRWICYQKKIHIFAAFQRWFLGAALYQKAMKKP
jgi:hypothetical protein